MTAVRDELERELQRVVHRLGSMPLTRVPGCAPQVYSAAHSIVNLTGEHPAADLPHLQPHALGAMLAVVGHDYLTLPQNDERDQLVLDQLIALRRALP